MQWQLHAFARTYFYMVEFFYSFWQPFLFAIGHQQTVRDICNIKLVVEVNLLGHILCMGSLDLLAPVKPVQQAMKCWREEKRGSDNEGQPRIERVKPGEELTRGSLWHVDRPHAA